MRIYELSFCIASGGFLTEAPKLSSSVNELWKFFSSDKIHITQLGSTQGANKQKNLLQKKQKTTPLLTTFYEKNL
jgi:hypothetical protein